MRRFLLDSRGVLRPAVMVIAVLVVVGVVLGLASLGGWAGMAGILLVLGACLLVMVRFG
ncbi:hypothetical protein [Amycolatopsis nalaikhensis]|uniref:Uncharacterized protein n=1 Tax=Amycolatopsis nalaikhensis TaxID=715472 RepID=A0ABY8XUD7_9PSEU|nr:hypothetical protein [Amycolatopsis sp. 2-2]WIV59249.1 hypothetical protein QP939_11775 [Amycolatopsis sp. 2-2]